MSEVEVEIGDLIYEVEVTSFVPASSGGWSDPPDYGEIELCNSIVVREFHGDGRDPTRHPDITLDELVRLFAEERAMTDMARARGLLEDLCYDDMMSQYFDSYDDREV